MPGCILDRFQELKPFLADVDHTDTKTAEGDKELRAFIASMLSFSPWWIILLYRIRAVVVRLLGLAEQEMPESAPKIQPGEIPMTPGGKAAFFTVRLAESEKYWIAETPEDKHLKAYICVIAESLPGSRKRFHVVTIVKYKHWTGPLYFNLIRPFHHLVACRMVQAGVKGI